VAQEGEAGAANHLPLDHLGLGVHALGLAVVEGQRDGGDHGLGVQVQAAGEGMNAGQSAARGAGAHSLSLAWLAGSGRSRAARPRTRPARLVISGQAAVSFAGQCLLVAAEGAGPGEQHPGGAPG
jgi:hypothetical protein